MWANVAWRLTGSNAMALRKPGNAWSKYSGLCSIVFSIIITNWFKKLGSLLGDLYLSSISRVGANATREFIKEFSTDESPVLNSAEYEQRTASMSTLVRLLGDLEDLSNKKLLFSDSELENTSPILWTSFLKFPSSLQEFRFDSNDFSVKYGTSLVGTTKERQQRPLINKGPKQ